MSPTVLTTSHRTLLDALMAAFEDAQRSPDSVAEPIAILWPDPDGQWQDVVARLRSSYPRVYSLGSYNPTTLTGPAIWLRCVADGSLPDVSPQAGEVPVLYLPGVSRQDLRAGGDSPSHLQPLVELQFRGKVWHHPNNREWTADGFLTSEAGLGLDIAKDATTREAMLRTLPLLADVDLTLFRGRRLDATDFDRLAVDDPIRDLLRWMNDPDGTKASLDGPKWPAFRSMIRAQFGLDPADDPRVDAAAKLVRGGEPWDAVWKRFCENPRLYPGIPRLLRDPAVAGGELPLDTSRHPTENDVREDQLRKTLEEAARLPSHEACGQVLALEKEHGRRREWVWAEIGDSPLAMALEPLAHLAESADEPLGAASLDQLVERYVTSGWRCDAAAMAALGAPLRAPDEAAVHAVVRTIYLPWLDESARHLQELAASTPDRLRALVKSPTPERDTCVLFVDGLRFDVGGALHEVLEARSLATQLTHRLAPLPTVTPTAKPAASPAATAVAGTPASDDFCPVLTESDQPVTAQRLRDAMAGRGVEVLDADEVRLPTGDHGGWTEGGQLDQLGHKLGIRLAAELSREVERLADRISALLDGGWRRVRVVTDHGWLLMPGGLPKVDLPKFLTETRWARCAVVKGDSATTMPVWQWYWNPMVRIATPPGVACFHAGNDYTHGGVSLQELVTPELLVERGIPEAKPRITEVSWARLRCRVRVTEGRGLRLDIRANWKDPDTSIVAAIKEPDAEGQVALVVKDDEYEGAGAVVVLIDPSGHVVDRKAITVGDA